MHRAVILTLCLATAHVAAGNRGEAQQPSPQASGGGRVARQLLLGAAGAIAGSVGLAMVGSRLEPDCSCDDPGLMGAVFGGIVGAALGPAIPVYLIGRGGPQKGSFAGAVLGGAMGVGGFLAVASTAQLDPDYAPFWVGFWGLPAVGAVAGYYSGASPAPARVTVPLERLQLSVGPTWQARRGPGVAGTLSF